MLHYDGKSWSKVSVPSGEILRDVWGSGPSDVFVTGDSGHIIHYDGASWKLMASSTTADLRGVWGSGPNDVYVVGLGPVLRYNGTAWSPVATPATYMLGVWGSGGEVFAVGSAGMILRCVAGVWTTMPSGTAAILGAVWGTSPTNVYAVSGSSEILLRYDGVKWSLVATPASKSNEQAQGVWGTAPNNIYLPGGSGILYHLGATWTRIDTGVTHVLVDMWGSGGSLFIVGQAGVILH